VPDVSAEQVLFNELEDSRASDSKVDVRLFRLITVHGRVRLPPSATLETLSELDLMEEEDPSGALGEPSAATQLPVEVATQSCNTQCYYLCMAWNRLIRTYYVQAPAQAVLLSGEKLREWRAQSPQSPKHLRYLALSPVLATDLGICVPDSCADMTEMAPAAELDHPLVSALSSSAAVGAANTHSSASTSSSASVAGAASTSTSACASSASHSARGTLSDQSTTTEVHPVLTPTATASPRSSSDNSSIAEAGCSTADSADGTKKRKAERKATETSEERVARKSARAEKKKRKLERREKRARKLNSNSAGAPASITAAGTRPPQQLPANSLQSHGEASAPIGAPIGIASALLPST
jgi:hypothetical protein